MAKQCDRCVENLPWHFDVKTSYLEVGQSLQAFTLNVFITAMQNIVSNVAPTVKVSANVPFFNLCHSCWGKAAGGWCERGADVYHTVPAKTADDGVYLHNGLKDYYEGGDTNGKLSLVAIQSIIVHEAMHYLSADHKGLQSYEPPGFGGFHWDECITDYLARQSYFKVCNDTYKTNYGDLSGFLDTVVDEVCVKPVRGFKLNNLKTIVDKQEMPEYIAEAIRKNPANGQRPFDSQEIKEKLKQDLCGWMCSWYFLGPEHAPTLFGTRALTFRAFKESEFGGFVVNHLNDTTSKYGTPMEFKKA